MWTRFVQWTVDIYRDNVLNAAVLMDTVEKDARVRSNNTISHFHNNHFNVIMLLYRCE